MKRTLVFIFLNPQADENTKGTVETENVCFLTIGVKDYEQAAKTAKEFAEQGVAAIELCGGFGNMGVAKVTEAVAGKVQVGVVRFDNHPGYNGESGDMRFL